MGYRLCTIHEKENTVIVTELRDLTYGCYHTKNIRCMGYRHQPGLWRDGLFKSSEIKGIVGFDSNEIESHTLFSKMTPGQQVGMMLKDGRGNAVAPVP